MKKFFILLLAALIIGLSACSGDTSDQIETDDSYTESETFSSSSYDASDLSEVSDDIAEASEISYISYADEPAASSQQSASDSIRETAEAISSERMKSGGAAQSVPPSLPESIPSQPSVSYSVSEQSKAPQEPSSRQQSSKADSSGVSVPDQAKQVLDLVNQERAAVGLNPVTINVNVQSAAQIRAQEIVSSFSHTRPDGRSCFTALKESGVDYRGAGENIAMGQTSAQQVMNGWMNSTGHRENILNPKFIQIGIGVYKDSIGRYYWTQMFIY